MGISKEKFLSSLDSEHTLLFAHIYDLSVRSEKRYESLYGDFLSENSIGELMKRQSYLPVSPVLFGGFPDAERKMVGFISEFEEASFPISAVRITSMALKTLSHRDFLGSVMALGIKREKCGDIIISDNHCDIILHSDIAQFVASSINKIGRAGVKTTLIPLSSLTIPEKKLVPVTGTVSSLRLDAVISLLTGKGRAKSSEIISGGLVFVNGICTQKCDMHLSGGETISVRGFGKAVLEVGGKSKKDRTFITLNKFS